MPPKVYISTSSYLLTPEPLSLELRRQTSRDPELWNLTPMPSTLRPDPTQKEQVESSFIQDTHTHTHWRDSGAYSPRNLIPHLTPTQTLGRIYRLDPWYKLGIISLYNPHIISIVLIRLSGTWKICQVPTVLQKPRFPVCALSYGFRVKVLSSTR